MEKEEAIADGANEGDGDAQTGEGGQASGTTNRGEEKIERVYKESDDTGDQEYVVPMGYNVAVGCEDLVAP